MTIGAKELASRVVPNGWIAKRRTRIVQVTPTIVEVEMSG